MMQRWSKHMTEPLRSFLRRGVLLLLAPIMAVTVALSPLATQPASAAISDFGLGGNSCAIETVGWVICPTVRSIARLADKGFTYINQSSLSINYQLFGGTGRTFTAWEVMRSIANAMFVVVFLFIIYGYLSGRTNGIYSIKRLLPRLLIAAIAVNISYYLGVILIDISNIIGDSIWNFLKNIYNPGSPVMPLGAPASPLSDGNLTKMAAAAMGNTNMVWVLLPPILAVTVTIAIISAAMVILLIAREAIVAALILAAPVLIVLYLLPNLERLASQAMRLFLQLLLLYPIVALLLGTGQIVSMAAGGWDNQSAFYGGGTFSIVPDLVAAAAAVVPLLGIWFLFKNLSALMSTAGSRLSATVSGRRGNKGDEKARVTGKATSGAASSKNTSGILGRRQAFSRNRRHRSLGGSSLTGDNELTPENRAGSANTTPRRPVNENEALQNSIKGGGSEDPTKKLEDLQNARINGDADEMNVNDAVAAAMAAGQDDKGGNKQDEHKTAKDIFNNLNHAHESKDKDRKFNAGAAPAGNNNSQSGGGAQPTAPTTSYSAPVMAQNNNIVTGSSPQQQVKVIAVPVQVDGSALIGKQNHSSAGGPPDAISQPPISGTEEKAKARAQKYLFDAGRDVEDAQNKLDIMNESKSTPIDPSYPNENNDTKKDDKS